MQRATKIISRLFFVLSLVDDKNVHKGLKIKIFLKTSLLCVKFELFQKSVFCRLKKAQN